MKQNSEVLLWDRREVARQASVSVRTVAEWMKQGLGYIKPSYGMVRFRPEDVRAFLAKFEVGSK